MITCVFFLACGSAYGGVSDPPSRVARINSIEGTTTVQDAGGARLAPVTHNWPVAPGDRVRTEEHSRAELDLGDVLLLLGSSSELQVEELTPALTKLRIAAGIANIDVSDSLHETINLELAQATIQISAPGTYRIEVRENGDAWMIVRRGGAKISTEQAVFEQRSDEEIAIARDGTFAIEPVAAGKDPNRRAERGPARMPQGVRIAEHVAPTLAGYRDLADYGLWRWIPEYGMVWEPSRVIRDWAPYRFGRWIWKSPWGWTWVDDAPWGFTPFHFGRWARIGTRWIWVPGPRQVAVAFAPALVRWVQAPHERDSIGWYPLAPGEEYIPPYPATDRHKRDINLFSVVRSGTAYSRAVSTERGSPAGLTWASRAAFARHPAPDRMTQGLEEACAADQRCTGSHQ